MISTDPNHRHIYDAQGRMTCCSLEDKIYNRVGAEALLHPQASGSGNDASDSEPEYAGGVKQYLPAAASLIMLLAGIAADAYFKFAFFTGFVRLAWYIVAYLPVGLPVIRECWETLRNREFFTEFTLMLLATVGAFAIGEYPEGVAVMLFYSIGELFQCAAVSRAKNNIKALLDVRPDVANVIKNGKIYAMKPEDVIIGEIIQVRAGEKVPLDGEMLSAESRFDTAALTGESRPKAIRQGEQALAGMLNLDKVVEVKITRMYADCSLSRILDMVQNATTRKAKPELLVRKFAKIYTPIIFFLAAALVVIPYFFVSSYQLSEWFYRALIFLVISCPCALVISIPLGYFGGIGAASKNGILFKGSSYLDLITKVNTVVMDKTGTLTKGVFRVQKIVTVSMNENEFIKILAALESHSTHPIAKAVAEYESSKAKVYQAKDVQEISGYGLQGNINGNEVLAGNAKLLKKFGISYDAAVDDVVESIVVVAINNQYAGYVLIADEIKEDARQAIEQMHEHGVTQTVMLSGDKSSITQKVAQVVGVDIAFGDLLPENKVQKVEEIKSDKTRIVAFVGDGINDAPVLALSDIGIAMGAMGSDAAIETADVVIQTDQPSKIATAIKIGRATKSIVIQNIALAFGIKVAVLILGVGGLATMWEAVFADVGVALLAILNAVRIQKKKF
ncbi:MAG: cadmium-translocating P-type ATPase [Prevotellaceae bacterium]|nr:cadmium-translocating P-type ATPase [Prevotellaceae bacterium]